MVYASPNASVDYYNDLTSYLATITALLNPGFILVTLINLQKLFGQLILAQPQLPMIFVSVYLNLTSLNL